MHTNTKRLLPPKYHFSEWVNEDEAIALYVNGGWSTIGEQTTEAAMWTFTNFADLSVPVNDKQDSLVGIGFLHENKLFGLMVAKEHRGRGIGEAILRERLNYVDTQHEACSIEYLDETNTIRHKYIALGFTVLADASLYRPAQS